MAGFSDKAQTSESMSATLDNSMNVAYPCLKCGKATKEHVGASGSRICCMPSCRAEYHVSELKAVHVEGDAPKYPCKKCGKETKEHVGGGRICSSPVCSERIAALAAMKSS